MGNLNSSRGWLVEPAGGVDPTGLSDEELLARCQKCGLNARVWMRRFAAMLPEIARRRLYRRKGFLSLGEFAAKLAGMSGYAVDKVLAVSRHLENKPALRKLFESGAVGWAKLEKVVYVATSETDSDWAEKAQCLSTRALEVYVQNYRRNSTHVSEQEDDLQVSQHGEAAAFGVGSEAGGRNLIDNVVTLSGGANPPVRFSCPVDEGVEFGLRVVKQDLEKQAGQCLTWNEAIGMVLLENRENKVQKCFCCINGRGVVKICDSCAKKLTENEKKKIEKITKNTP